MGYIWGYNPLQMAEHEWVAGIKILLNMGVMDGYGALLMVPKSCQPLGM